MIKASDYKKSVLTYVITIGGIVVVLLLVAILFLFFGKPRAGNVTSSDGSIELAIPEDALPAGVSLEDIKINKLSDTESGVTLDGEAPLLAYALEPRGIEFNTPISVTLTADLSDSPFPVLYNVSEKKISIVQNLSIEEDSEGNPIALHGELNHFSTLVLYRKRFKATVSDPGKQFIGVPFNVSVQVVRLKPQIRILAGDPPFPYTSTIVDPWNIRGILREADTGSALIPNKLKPTVYNSAPPSTSYSGDSFTANFRFTCVKKGTTNLTYQVWINGQDKIVFGEGTTVIEKFQSNNHPFAGKQFECVAPAVKVIRTAGSLFPAGQFRVVGADVCVSEHIHLKGTATALDGATIVDPDPDGCGIGTTDTVPTEIISLGLDQIENYTGPPFRLESGVFLDTTGADIIISQPVQIILEAGPSQFR